VLRKFRRGRQVIGIRIVDGVEVAARQRRCLADTLWRVCPRALARGRRVTDSAVPSASVRRRCGQVLGAWLDRWQTERVRGG
jgi:hypothetical protein